MRSVILAFWLSGFLVGCGSAQPSDAPSATAVATDESGRPILMPAGLDIVPEIAKAGSPWADAPLSDHGSGYPITRRSVMYSGGLVDVDRSEYGGVDMIKVQSGIGTKCGDAAPMTRALAYLAKGTGLRLPSSPEVAKLDAAWRAPQGWHEVTVSGALYRAIGGCLKVLVVKAV